MEGVINVKVIIVLLIYDEGSNVFLSLVVVFIKYLL